MCPCSNYFFLSRFRIEDFFYLLSISLFDKIRSQTFFALFESIGFFASTVRVKMRNITDDSDISARDVLAEGKLSFRSIRVETSIA